MANLTRWSGFAGIGGEAAAGHGRTPGCGTSPMTRTSPVTAGPSFAITDDSKVKRVGVNIAGAAKRYYRIKATQASATTGGYFCGLAILGKPRYAPTTTL